MAVTIRLRQSGRTNRIMYRVVVADSRSPRDGKYVETLGWYNPIEPNEQKNVEIDRERILHWLGCGAQLSENVRCLVARIAPDILEMQQAKAMEKRTRAAERRRAKREQPKAK